MSCDQARATKDTLFPCDLRSAEINWPCANATPNSPTIKPRPEAHMNMILFEVFLKNIHLIAQDQIVQ